MGKMQGEKLMIQLKIFQFEVVEMTKFKFNTLYIQFNFSVLSKREITG